MVARKRICRVSRKAQFLPSKQAHASSPMGANFHPPFFLLQRVWFNPKRVWEQNNGEIWIWNHISVPMHGYNLLFGREMAQIQPPTHTVDPTPLFLAQKCFISCFLLPRTIKSQKTMRFVLGTKFGWEWWFCLGGSSPLMTRQKLKIIIRTQSDPLKYLIIWGNE